MHIWKKAARAGAVMTAAVFVGIGVTGPVGAVDDHADPTAVERSEGARGEEMSSENQAAAAENRSSAQAGEHKESAGAESRPEKPARAGEKKESARAESRPETSGERSGKADPPGHDPVTVCHLLGNGSYIVLTFDDSALQKHLSNHDDLMYDEAEGCPEATLDVEARRLEAAKLVLNERSSGTVLGAEQHRARTAATVRGESGTTTVTAAAGTDQAGVLPAAGAGEYTAALLAGLGLLGAGAYLMRRRRPISR